VSLIVGYGTGGGFDVYGRLMARHLGRHIPGQPNVVVQNMPGRRSLRANHLYTTTPKDGSDRNLRMSARSQPKVRAIDEIAGAPPDLVDYMKKLLPQQRR
jgi:hypothetical protein